MKIFVTGVDGQLGHDLINELNHRGHETIGSDIAEINNDNMKNGSPRIATSYVSLDITDAAAVEQLLTQIQPDVVIHCAAWTAVDAAEDADKIELVYAVNVDGTKHMAASCKKLDCKMVYISTDYVFDGHGVEPWQPDCKDFHPLNVYGQTKLDGELAVATILEKFFIVRIAWVFGANGENFVKTMLRIGKEFGTLHVVDDQIGTPTYTYDLSRLLADMIETEKYGYYHVTNEGGYISWYDFAKEIFRQTTELGNEEYAEDKLTVIPVTTEEYGISKAARPFNSRMDKSKLIENDFEPLPTWQDAVHRFLLTELNVQK